jgi:SagB-type dehydrogenase family enzyme
MYRCCERTGNQKVLGIAVCALVMIAVAGGSIMDHNSYSAAGSTGAFVLPPPRLTGTLSVEEALQARRSVRGYTNEAITLAELGQLLWAAQGITSEPGLRTAPSAGALYPLEVYVVAGNVEGLAPGVYKYQPAKHTLTQVLGGDRRAALWKAALEQAPVRDAPVSLVLTAVHARTAQKYRGRAERYVHIEVGHAAQNVYLQAESLNLGTVAVGAFDDDTLGDALSLPTNERPLYLMPVGKKH